MSNRTKVKPTDKLYRGIAIACLLGSGMALAQDGQSPSTEVDGQEPSRSVEETIEVIGQREIDTEAIDEGISDIAISPTDPRRPLVRFLQPVCVTSAGLGPELSRWFSQWKVTNPTMDQS